MKHLYLIIAIITLVMTGCGDVSVNPDNDSSSSDSSSSDSSSSESSSSESSSSEYNISLLDTSIIEEAGTYDSKSLLYELSGSFSKDLTFGDSCYVVVTGTVTMDNADLTFGKSCRIYVKEEAYISLDDNANIFANGTSDDIIKFMPLVEDTKWGYENGTDYSGAISFQKKAGNKSELSWVKIDGATTAILVYGDEPVKITNSMLVNSEFYGLNINGGKLSDDALVSTTFSGNEVYDVRTEASNLGSFGKDNNFEMGVQIEASTVEDDAIMPMINAPYFIVGNIAIKNSLKEVGFEIQAGAVLKLMEEKYISVGELASLHVAGTEKDSVYFENMNEGKYWGYENGTLYSGGIRIQDGVAKKNIIEYASIKGATIGISLDEDNALTLKHSSLTDCEYFGLITTTGIAAANTIDSNSFSNNELYDATTTIQGAGAITSDNDFAKGVRIVYSTASDDLTLNKLNAPYFIEKPVTFSNSLKAIEINISAGAEFKFFEDADLNVSENATLKCNGEDGNMIKMSPMMADTYWGHNNGTRYSGGIIINEDAGVDNVINWTEITEATTGVLVIKTNMLSISNSILSNNEYYAVAINETGGQLKLDENNTYSGNGLGDIQVD